MSAPVQPPTDHYDPPIPDEKGRIPLFYVVVRAAEDPERIARYILVKKNNPNAIDANQDTPLHWAVWNKRPVAASALLEHGADPTLANYKGDTPLHHLFSRPIDSEVSVRLLELLIDAGADPSITNNRGRTAYHELACCHVRNLECASRMVEILTRRFGTEGWAIQTPDGLTPQELASTEAPDNWILKIGATIVSQSLQVSVDQVEPETSSPAPRNRF